MSSPSLAVLQSVAISGASGAFSGAVLGYGFCKTKMKELALLGVIVNVVETILAELATHLVLRNAVIGPSTGYKVAAIKVGGILLSLSIMFFAAYKLRQQENQRVAQDDLNRDPEDFDECY